MKRAMSLFAALLAGGIAFAQTPKKVLFDHTGWEDGGTSAYWIIDTHEPNPSPAAPTAETSWNGGISAWAFDLYKKGYAVQTLPASGGRITYNDATNAQDLKNYSVYVIPECYRMFTAAEKQAIVAFVQAGGGLYMMGNHDGSARVTSTHPGSTDAFHVFNDLLANEASSFGFTFVEGHGPGDANADTTTTAITPGTGPIEQALVHGPNGLMTAMDFHSYGYLNLTGSNPSAKWIVQTQVSGDPATDYFVVAATVGAGRVVAIGDSAPSDDGTTTTSGKNLHNDYTSNSNRAFLLNAVDWLAGGTSGGGANTVTASISTPSGNVTVASGASQAFAGSATDSASGAALTYGWNFGDGSTSTAASTSHVFTNTGTSAITRTVTFTATDGTGASGRATRTVTVSPAPSGSSFSEGFESGTKAAYATGNVTFASGTWTLNDALLGNTSSDAKSGTQSVRMRNSGQLVMLFNFPTGAKTVTVKHGLYGSDSSCTWGLWYSTNNGGTWTQAGSSVTTSSTALKTATFTVNKTGAIRFEIRKTDGSSRRVNFDDFHISGY